MIMTENFEETWDVYMENYEICQPDIFFQEMQQELERRLEK